MFENLSTVLDENEDHLLYPSLKIEITQHLKSLESELKKYFPDFEEEDGKLVRNPFSGTLDIATIPNDVQDEFLDLKNDSAAKDLYEERSLTSDSAYKKLKAAWLHYEEFKDWHWRVESNPNRAYCRSCRTDLSAEISSLKRNKISHMHNRNVERMETMDQEMDSPECSKLKVDLSDSSEQ
ncbi:uncharacterized protein LOC121854588 [Homarus americanus]|uniref:uncharacterized protein LOC121854588 n=1 Tax=Homarus americanus TaxID=6706 RepID=UPI001C46495A|nr:uncharacterized protein LOC121854588 [Homarus americanus]